MAESDSAPTRFARAGGRNRFTAREATVTAVRQVTTEFVRVTVTGDEFADFPEAGPADHVRLFFPREEDGVLIAPAPVGPGQDGIVRPEEAVISRDFTPAEVRRTHAAIEVDIDFLLHEDPGPAVRWATRAAMGDRLVVVGPRGSKDAPSGANSFVLIVDGTALPSAARWIRAAAGRETIVVVDTASGIQPATDYLAAVGARAGDVRQRAGTASDVDDLPINEGTFVFAAGEAGSLISIRDGLRDRLARDQFAVSGYWRRGVVGFDHHAPLDPEHP